jgi:hypothetical protein
MKVREKVMEGIPNKTVNQRERERERDGRSSVSCRDSFKLKRSLIPKVAYEEKR